MNHLVIALFSLGIVGVSNHAAGQNRVVVHGLLTTAVSGGDTNAAVSGGAGYERGRLRVSGEITQTTRLPPNFVHILGEESWTKVTAVTANARFRIPLGAMRGSAYGLGGVGAARVTDAFTVVYVLPGPNPITTTYSRAAFTAGGGLSIPITDRLAFDAEARVLRIAGDRSRSIGRVGGGVSVRF